MKEQRKLDISVLYVEDDKAARDEVALFLTRRVRELFVASNGEEGLAQFRQRRPDLIVTDIRMPVMDGLTMARKVLDLYKGALFVVTTAHSDTPYLMDAIDIGITQFVVKPINTERLAGSLEKCLEIIEHRRSHRRFIAEREQLIAELQKAFAEIKTLQGILPICSFCKRIRDDKGAWNQLETYISKHTDALFSHGMCSECAKKQYPTYFKEEKK